MGRILVVLVCFGWLSACLNFDETGKTFRCDSNDSACNPVDMSMADAGCGGMTCGAPPASECVDATTVRQFQSQALCSANVCTYPSTVANCPFGCAAGACKPNPCVASTCAKAPAAHCTSDKGLRTYAEAGFCDPNGSCQWASIDIGCPYGCTAGNCTGGACTAVTCNAAPPPTCVGSASLRTYASSGSCNNGACTYSHTDSACANGCEAGACKVDPCAGVTCNKPPAPTCLNAATLRTPSASGQCLVGECKYGSVDTVCASGCEAGACKADPCTGVSCNAPPAATCTGPNTLRSFSAGSCSAGTCSYVPSDTACANGCTAGACVGNSCPMGVTCTTPPMSSCEDSKSVRSFNPVGMCNMAGACTYTSITTSCSVGEECFSGKCKWTSEDLSALSISPGTLSFSPAKKMYLVSVPNGTTAVSVTATHPAPTRVGLRINAVVVASGASTPVPLVNGSAMVVVSVKSEASFSYIDQYRVLVSTPAALSSHRAYVKASNTGEYDLFGAAVALSGDGNTLAVGAYDEESKATGINGDALDNSAKHAGAVYVFSRAGGTWTQTAYLKASNAEADDEFGSALSLSADGNVLAVGAAFERSSATGVNGNQADNSLSAAGAVYVFTRTVGAWAQTAYLKASNTEAYDSFGDSLALSGDGATLVVGAPREDSASTGINGNQSTNTVISSGAAYVFVRSGPTWVQEAYVKASNAKKFASFGGALALSYDGSTLAVGSESESSAATGVGGNQADESAGNSGAVYVFVRASGTWTQQAYVKASNTQSLDVFGVSLALSASGDTLVVGASGEDSAATGVNGNQADNSLTTSGAVYVFGRSGGTWAQAAYLKASNTGSLDYFGRHLALSSDGNTLAVGAPSEDGNGIGTGGSQADNSVSGSGAVYVYRKSGGVWAQTTYLKSSNTMSGMRFGDAVALSADGTTLAVGAPEEDSGSTGINSDGANDAAHASGAAYIYAP